MPYNNNPIPRPGEISGSVSLPLARVKKIINADEDINACSANAAFAIAVATEEFVYYLTEQAYKMAKAEKKPKRSLAYTHVQSAVARLDNLEFLTDVVPKTQAYRDAKAERENKKKEKEKAQAAEATQAAANGTALPNGQTTLDGPSRMVANDQATAGAEKHEGDDAMDVDTNGAPA